MKTVKILLVLLLSSVLFTTNSVAEKIEVNPSQENSIEILENTYHKLLLSNTLNTIYTFDVNTSLGVFNKLSVDGYSKTNIVGSPELPAKSELIEVPVNAELKVRIVNSSFVEYELMDLGLDYRLIPAQAPVSKSMGPDEFILDNEAYNSDEFYPGTLADAENLGILRGLQIGRVDIFPLQYNPVSGMIRIYTEIQVEITFSGGDIPLTHEMKKLNQNIYFSGINNQLINYTPLNSRDTISSYPVKYVIVSDPMFEPQLQPFIEWKTKKGFEVIEAYTDDPAVGNTKFEIKAYLQSLYEGSKADENPPTFVLFVGDTQQIPAWNGNAGGHVTDLFYCEYTNDYFPEIYYGRMSAKTTAHLQPQIDKTLQYEQYTMPDPSYLNEVVMVAGVDGSHGYDWANGQINYGTENYFNETNGITSHTYLYPESGNHSADIIQDISNGVTFGNYTAHCSPNGWADPSFVISDIPTLQNQDMYGLLVGNCCSSSEYQQDECFAEEIVRAENKGAVAYIGGSNSTYWDEDYYWGVGVGQISENPPPYEETSLGMYDRVWHTHDESFEDWYTTSMQMVFAGNLAVTEGASGSAEYYWEIYCVMGDPSLTLYFSVPPEISVSHMPILILNTMAFEVNTEPYAYVAISKDGILHGSALADATGYANVPIIPFTTPGFADVVVTKQNGEPYIGTVITNDPDGPFIMLHDFNANDINGNQNGIVDCGEIIALDIELRNFGNSDGTNVVATLSTSDSYITLTDEEENIDLVTAQSTFNINDAYSFILSPDVPDEHIAHFDLIITDDTGEEWSSDLEISCYAPDLQITSFTVDDATGNNNGRLDPGENADLIIVCANRGHTIAENTMASLNIESGFVQVNNSTQNIGDVGFFGNKTIVYPLEVSSDATDGIIADAFTTFESGNGEFNDARSVRIGMVSEDFETGDFTKFNWLFEGNAQWEITSDYPYAGFFSTKSPVLGNGQSAELMLNYHVMCPDVIQFTRKVSSHEGDQLRFYIDDELKGFWSGTNQGWTAESFFVMPGAHDFKWVYTKDGSETAGADCAWLDDIILPCPVATTLYAGNDDSECTTNSYQLSAEATYFDNVAWNTSGDGSFNDNTLLYAIYNPGENDIINGSVNLTLSVYGSDGNTYNDELILSLEELSEQPQMPDGPEYINLEEVLISEYSIDPVSSSGNLNWHITPPEAGTFTGDGITGTIVWNRDFSGEANIMVAGNNQCGEGPMSDGLQVIVENPFVRINENKKDDFTVNVYPNPNNGIFTLNFGENSPEEIFVRLIDMTGRLIYSKIISTNSSLNLMNLDQLHNGLYFLVLEGNGKQCTKKIIVR